MPFSIHPYHCFPLLLAALLFLSGCGGAYWQWSKPGVSQQQARQDDFECKQISRRQSYLLMGPMMAGSSSPDLDTWKECLEARGYSVREQSDSQGNSCLSSNATVGARRKLQNGKVEKITALYGTSPRCSDPTTPMLADVEEVSDGQSSSQTVSQGTHCVASTATIGTQLKMTNGKIGSVRALYGTSPRCSNPVIPVLADVEED